MDKLYWNTPSLANKKSADHTGQKTDMLWATRHDQFLHTGVPFKYSGQAGVSCKAGKDDLVSHDGLVIATANPVAQLFFWASTSA
jgi:hypothetical protein